MVDFPASHVWLPEGTLPDFSLKGAPEIQHVDMLGPSLLWFEAKEVAFRTDLFSIKAGRWQYRSVEAYKTHQAHQVRQVLFFGVGTCRRPTWSLGGMNSCEGSWALGLRMFAVASRSSRHYQLDHVGSARIQSPTWDGFSWQSLGLRTTMCSISVSSSGVWDRSMLCVFFSEVTCEATHFLQLVVPVLSVLTHVFPSVCIFQFLQDQQQYVTCGFLRSLNPNLGSFPEKKQVLAHLLRSVLTSGIPFKIVSRKLTPRAVFFSFHGRGMYKLVCLESHGDHRRPRQLAHREKETMGEQRMSGCLPFHRRTSEAHRVCMASNS